MNLLIKCPSCCRNFAADGTVADKRVKCTLCGRLFKVPNTNEYGKAEKIINSSKTTLYVDQKGQIFG
ncbi:MAG: hypothetical protein PHP01_00820 [Phycisphaerae bacterium]|nr:hypothetical protein [Phycisphaerae bacterium]